MLWLLRGNWTAGWPEYQWRLRTKAFARFGLDQHRWDGAPLAGRTVLVRAEQGLGDTLQFIRYLPFVQQASGRVTFLCQAPLLRLLKGAAGIDWLMAEGCTSSPFDVQAPLLDLPGLFHTTPSSVPASIPYLHADADLFEHWRGELRESAEFNVRSARSEDVASTSHFPLRTSHLLIGIAWQGSPTYYFDRQRSIPLTHFARFSELEGVKLISLQKGPGLEQLQYPKAPFPVLDLSNCLDTVAGPFMDTAALMLNLDLVITSDSAIAHLAGALGIPVWVALPRVPDWRWLLEREDTPWYPTMRLFRQKRYGHWEDVFDDMIEEMRRKLAR
jgi:hypothetical protein